MGPFGASGARDAAVDPAGTGIGTAVVPADGLYGVAEGAAAAARFEAGAEATVMEVAAGGGNDAVCAEIRAVSACTVAGAAAEPRVAAAGTAVAETPVEIAAAGIAAAEIAPPVSAVGGGGGAGAAPGS